jgi:hypothetical protein
MFPDRLAKADMSTQLEHPVELVERPRTLAPAKPHVPSYQVRWTPRQKWQRLWTEWTNWLKGRLYRRFLQWNAGGVAFWLSQLPIVFTVVATLVRLRVFDRLAEKPLSSDELAEATGTDRDALHRFLRTATDLGLLKRDRNDKFSLRPVGRQFLQDSPNPVAAWTELHDRTLLVGLPQMTEALVSGESLPKTVTGKTCWEIMEAMPGTTELHDKACSGWTELVVDKIAHAYDFSQVRTVIDVGGGRGAFLSAMLKAAPHVTGRVYDRSTTELAAQARFEQQGVADRAAHVCGNFFESVPAGADLYTIKHVLHDWDDASALQILRNIRDAVPAHGKLLIVEGSVDHKLLPAPLVRSIWDVTQFAASWGKSRTLDEFSALAHKAGFRLANIYVPPTIDALILECVPE